MLGQLIQIAGSLLILTAFALAQARKLRSDQVSYLLLNVVGSATLAVLAASSVQWGFLLLEGCWAIVSAVGLVGAFRTATGERKPTGD